MASVAVAPRLPSPCSCSVAVRWAWTQSHYALVRDPIPQAFNPHPWEPRVELGPEIREPNSSAKSLEFEVSPRALGRIRPCAGGTGTNSDWCPRCLKSILGARFGLEVERSRDSPLELDSELESSLGLEFGAGIDPGKAGRDGKEVLEHFWLIDPPDFHHIYYKSFLRSYLWL